MNYQYHISHESLSILPFHKRRNPSDVAPQKIKSQSIAHFKAQRDIAANDKKLLQKWRYCLGCWKLDERSSKIPDKKVLWQKNPIRIPRGGVIELCSCLRVSDSVLFHLNIPPRMFCTYVDEASLAHECTLICHPSAKFKL